MSARRAGPVLLCLASAALVGGCGIPVRAPVGPDPTQAANPPARTSWSLRHRIQPTADLHVSTQSIGAYDEGSTVTFGPPGAVSAEFCAVTVSVPGQGGPDNEVGERTATTVDGRPGFRSGAGSESTFLMWELTDGSWVKASCDGDGAAGRLDSVVGAVQLRASSIALPFDPSSLPAGYGVSMVQTDLESGSAQVYLGRFRPEFGGLPDSDIVISYDRSGRFGPPSGRIVTVAGRPARIDETKEHPGVAVAVQDDTVSVRTDSGDTGPYPDLSGEIPVLLSIAKGLSYAGDLRDPSTWFAADRVLD